MRKGENVWKVVSVEDRQWALTMAAQYRSMFKYVGETGHVIPFEESDPDHAHFDEMRERVAVFMGLERG